MYYKIYWKNGRPLHLCNYSGVYIVVKEAIDLLAAAANKNDEAQKDVLFKNNLLFRSYQKLTKINSTLIENAEGLDIVMPMYNMLEYSDNYSMSSGSLWNYYRDEIDDVNVNIGEGNSFNRKTKTTGKIPAQPDADGGGDWKNVPPLDIEVTIPFKNLSNIWRSLIYFLLTAK